MSKEAILVHMPVLHRGYREFIERHLAAKVVYIFGEELIALFDNLYRKDLRALRPEEVVLALKSWGLGIRIEVANLDTLRQLNKERVWLVMPDEDVTRHLKKKYLSRCTIELDSVFLRRDKHSTTDPKPVFADRAVKIDALDYEMLSLAESESCKSSDWWRQVGAVAACGGELLIVTYNRHVPSPYIPYAFGDPRSNFTKGVHIELSTALHAEAALVSEAARRGIALKGASLYLTAFPCPPCAKLVAYAGFAKLYFLEGYAVLDGESILRSQGVDIVCVTQKPL